MKATDALSASRRLIDRRVGLRTRLTVPVLIETRSGPRSARLRNLSEKGAMVETQVPIGVGEHVTFACGSVQAEGIVAWEDDCYAGIEFDTPLAEDDVARQILRSNAVEHRRQALSANPK